MRVSLFLVIPLAFATVAIVWWQGVKGKDFLTPPPSVLLALQQKSLNQANSPTVTDLENTKDFEPTKAILVKPERMPDLDPAMAIEEPKIDEEVIDVGDLTRSPGLDAYVQFSEKGSAYFIQLATLLETSGEVQRALLAWERVADSSSPDAQQRQSASAAIARLRPQLPPWTVDPIARTPITIHAACDAETAKHLKPILKEIAVFFAESSSGIIRCNDDVTISPPASPRPLPTALWFSCAADKSIISKTITIPPGTSDPAQLRLTLLRSLYKIFREEIGAQSVCQPPVDLEPPPFDPSPLFQASVTRLHWQEFSKRFSPRP